MKKIITSASFDQPDQLQQFVERLACRRYELGFSKERVPDGLQAIETSSTEAYVSGTIALNFIAGTKAAEERINMPFITSFLFTCVKGENERYQLIWSTSLS